MQVNRWKIIYLNCGERYEDMIDHRSYTHNLSSLKEHSKTQIYDLSYINLHSSPSTGLSRTHNICLTGWNIVEHLPYTWSRVCPESVCYHFPAFRAIGERHSRVKWRVSIRTTRNKTTHFSAVIYFQCYATRSTGELHLQQNTTGTNKLLPLYSHTRHYGYTTGYPAKGYLGYPAKGLQNTFYRVIMRFLGMIRITRITLHHRTRSSLPRENLSAPWKHYDLSDIGSLIVIRTMPKKPTLKKQATKKLFQNKYQEIQYYTPIKCDMKYTSSF